MLLSLRSIPLSRAFSRCIAPSSRNTKVRMMSSTVHRDANQTIRVEPAGGNADSVVVLTHGLGDSAEGFVDVAQLWSQRMPTTRFVLPTASTQPVTLNGGMPMPSWYDITGLSDRFSEDCAGIQDSAEVIKSLLKSQHEGPDAIAYNRMCLAGFSQGGAMSLFTGLQLPKEQRLAGILVMSGYLAGGGAFKLTPELSEVPVLHQHGTADPMVKYSWAQQTQETVQGMGHTLYELQTYEGMQHEVCMEELTSGVAFLNRVLTIKSTRE